MTRLPKSVWTRLAQGASAPPATGGHADAAHSFANGHPDADLLNAFCEDALAPPEREYMLAHLAQCAQCREVVALVTPAEGPPRPAAEAKRLWLTFPVLRWAALAATVAVVLAVALLYRLEGTRSRSDAQMPASASLGKQAQESSPPAPSAASPAAELPVPAAAPPQPARTQPQPGATSSAAAQAKPGSNNHLAASTTSLAESPSREGAGSISRFTKDEAKRDNEMQSGDEQRRAATIHSMQTRTVHGPAVNLQQQQSPNYFGYENTSPAAKATKPLADKATAQNKFEAAPVRGDVVTGGPMAKSAGVVAGAPSAPPPQARQQVEVTAEAPAAAAPSIGGRAVLDSAAPSYSGDNLAKRKMTMTRVPLTTWSISPEGKLVRTVAGAAPEVVPVGENLTFRAVATVEADVWAAGARGLLYHSTDAGATWTKVAFPAADDIVSIVFTGRRDGDITTSTGQQYTTHDAGHTWTKKLTE